jgi:hypothetical protein
LYLLFLPRDLTVNTGNLDDYIPTAN